MATLAALYGYTLVENCMQNHMFLMLTGKLLYFTMEMCPPITIAKGLLLSLLMNWRISGKEFFLVDFNQFYMPLGIG